MSLNNIELGSFLVTELYRDNLLATEGSPTLTRPPVAPPSATTLPPVPRPSSPAPATTAPVPGAAGSPAPAP
ncbi:MAG: hypothetical protein ABUM51_09595, partial [Bacteroidota bacterium]